MLLGLGGGGRLGIIRLKAVEVLMNQPIQDALTNLRKDSAIAWRGLVVGTP